MEILASTASIFTQILAHKPQNLKIFSSQAPKFGNFSSQVPKFGNFPLMSPPPFSEANVSSQAPHFGNPGRTPLPEKKLSAPREPVIMSSSRGGGLVWPIRLFINTLVGGLKILNFGTGISNFFDPPLTEPRSFASPSNVGLRGGGTQLFSGRGVWPGFPKCGACELTIASEKGACERKFPNLGACELKISKFGGL